MPLILPQFFNWHYGNNDRRLLIKLHAAKQSKITVTQMFTESLPTRSNEALKRRKEGLGALERNELTLGMMLG